MMTFLVVIFMGTRKLFLKFTLRPVESEKDLSNLFRGNNCLALAGRTKSVSSAYKIMGKKSSKSLDSG